MFFDSFQSISFKKTFVDIGTCNNADIRTQSYILLLINNIFLMPFRHMLLDVQAHGQMITPIQYNIQRSPIYVACPGVALLQKPVICVFSRIKEALISCSYLHLETPFKINCKNNCLEQNLELHKERNPLRQLNETGGLQFLTMSLKSILPSTAIQNSSQQKEGGHQDDIILKVTSPLKNPVAENILAWFNGFTSSTIFNPAVCKEVNASAHPINLGTNRQRTSSEHSDDICFLEDKTGATSCYDDDETSDDDYDNYSSDESDSDLENCNEKIDYNIGGNDDEVHGIQNEMENLASANCSQTTANSSERKTVRFNLTPEIHTMHVWNFAYRSARKGHWESFARDRDRFRKRIQNASIYLNPILSCEHRSFIYKSRFSNEM